MGCINNMKVPLGRPDCVDSPTRYTKVRLYHNGRVTDDNGKYVGKWTLEDGVYIVKRSGRVVCRINEDCLNTNV